VGRAGVQGLGPHAYCAASASRRRSHSPTMVMLSAWFDGTTRSPAECPRWKPDLPVLAAPFKEAIDLPDAAQRRRRRLSHSYPSRPLR
jgi:hypothetical protein